MKTSGRFPEVQSIHMALQNTDDRGASVGFAVQLFELMRMVEGKPDQMQQLLATLANMQGEPGEVVNCVFRQTKQEGAVLIVTGTLREMAETDVVIGYVRKGSKAEWLLGSMLGHWFCQQQLQQASLFNNNRRRG